jgi:membrane protein implicated in regulation of membrane protease activity
MPPELRDRLGTVAICTGIVWGVFLIGWILRNHLGIPRSRLKGMWATALVAPLVLSAFLLAEALLPHWAMGLVLALFIAVVGPLVQSRLKAAEGTDPLCGRQGRVLVGHPDALRVEVDGEVWHASAEEGLIILQNERVTVRRREGPRLVVGRA